MNIIDRLENFKLVSQDHPDIAYLKSSSIGGVVNRALSDLYKVQPKNPVTFLANWLLNESRSNKIKSKIDNEKKLKEELKEVYNQRKIEEEKKRKEIEEDIAKVAEKKKNFLNKIKECKDIEKNMDSFCDELEHIVNATGVYVCRLDKKRRDVNEDEDEHAHLIDQQVIRYVNFSNSHNFLKWKYLEPEQGITYYLFKPKDDLGEVAVNENNENSNNEGNIDEDGLEKSKIIKEYIPNHILVDEVVRNPKIKFFREPRIGCYITIDLTYKSTLSTLSLTSAIEMLNEYNSKLTDYENRKNEFLAKLAEENAQKEQQQEGQEGQEGQNNVDNLEQVFPDENITLNEFEKIEKKYILCLDTIGQDRIFTDEEKKFIFETVKTIKNSWENLEHSLLLKDRDLKIDLNQKEAPYREPGVHEKLEAEEEKFIKDYFNQDNSINYDEREKQIETEFQKAKFILHSFTEDAILMELFLILKEFEVIYL